jgi:hypothetical protein
MIGAQAKWTRFEQAQQPQAEPGAVVAPSVRFSRKPIYDVDSFIDGLFEPRPWKSWLYITVGLIPSMHLVQRSNSVAEQIISVCWAIGGLVLGAGNEASVWVTRLDDSEWHRQAKQWRDGKNIETRAAPESKLDPTFQPITRVNGKLYASTTDKVAFDMERQFAKTLLIMHDFKPNDEAVDLRETTWKRPNKFGNRDAYVAVREKWEAYRIVAKSAARANAPYKVIDWEQVGKVAGGLRLPPLPQA